MRNKDGSIFVCSKSEVGIKISHLLRILKRADELKAISYEIEGKTSRKRGRRKKKTMPIYEAAGSLILHFGHGDIAVASGQNVEKDYEDEICFVRQTPHAIGEKNDELIGKATDVIDCPVRLIFDKVESLDVVIEELQKLRAKIEARK